MNKSTFLQNIMLFAGLLVVATTGWSQTNPAPQPLPYTQNFDALTHASTTYPAGWQGWTLAEGTGVNPSGATAVRLTPPSADRALTANGSASSDNGNMYNFNGKIGFLNTGSLDLSVALAINTTGRTGIVVNYDIMTIRNPYNGTTNTRINEVILQYRVGTTGNFVNLTGTEYQNNTVTQTGTGVTDPQNLMSRTITLPADANNQSEVQLRLASKQVSGGGSRPSFAIDNVLITGTALPSTNARLQTLILGGRDALALSGLVVTDPVADAGATMFVSNFAGFAGIVITLEHAGAIFTVTRNGVAVTPENLATVALGNGDVVVVRVVAEDGATVRYHKVTLQQEARTLAITLPIGGETYHTGQPVTVNWTSENVANVHLQVFLSGRPEPVAEFMGISAVLGTFTQPLPNGAHGQHFFRLVNAADPTHFVNSPMVTFIDNLAPTIVTLQPANYATGVGTTPTFIILADEDIEPISGKNIRLFRTSDNALIETLAATSLRVVITDYLVRFNFEASLATGTEYHILIDAGAFVDVGNNPLPAIGANQWRFSTHPLICNGDFEVWTDGRPDCWVGGRTNLPAASITQYAPGQSGVSAVTLMRTETSHQRFTTQPTSVVEGRRYNISFWAKGQGQIRTGLFDERTVAFGFFYHPYISLDSGTWQQFTQSITADNTSSIAEFIFSIHSTNAARNHIQIDNVTITEEVVAVNQVANLTALRAGTLGEIYQVTGEVTLTFQQAHRNQKFVQDAGAAILIDDPIGVITTTYSIGDGISTLRGTLSENNGMLILTPIADPGARTSAGNAIVPVVRTLASLTSADQARLVKIMGVRFDATGNFAGGMNYNLTSPEGNGVFRTAFPAADYVGVPIPTVPLNLTALVGQFQTTIQLTARSLADFETATALPGISVSRLLVFPNPFSNYIRVLNIDRASIVRIISSTGRVMKEYVSSEGDLEINTTSLKSGFYILQVITPDGKPIIQRLIKN